MNTDLTDYDLNLVAKYLNGEADENEIYQVDHWKNASDGNKLEFEKLKEAWELATAGIGFREWNKKKSKEQFLLKIIRIQSETIQSKDKFVFRTRKLIKNLYKYAAVVLLFIGISALLAYNFLGNHQNVTYTQIAVSKGSKSQMTLPDGSRVWLNADSKIKYASNFNMNNRNIFLEGEAFFEVAKNPHRTFQVSAGGIIVKALGTVFNVKAYPEDKLVEATLVEGSVSVKVNNKPGQIVILKPNEQVFYSNSNKSGNQYEKFLISKGINSDEFTSWINDQLTISGETLETLVVKLGRKYNVTFHFEDPSISQLRFTGILKDETIEQILDVLKLSSSINYRIHGREIWLSKKLE